MIQCPKCGADSGVVETRKAVGSARRRRRCGSEVCGHRFSTLELPLGVPTRDATDGEMVMVPRKYLDRMLEILSAAMGYGDT